MENNTNLSSTTTNYDEPMTSAADSSKEKEWYEDERFNFFWSNYRTAFTTSHHAQQTVNRIAQEQQRFIQASVSASRAAHQAACALLVQNASAQEAPAKRQRKRKRRGTSKSSSEQHQQEKSPRKEEQDAKFEFEISEDLLKFYEQSFLFKREKKEEEKKRLRDLAEGKVGDYVIGEQVKTSSKWSSIKPPLEKADQKRQQELAELYGEKATTIHLTETMLQMIFDKNVDLYQPIYWPSLPLRL